MKKLMIFILSLCSHLGYCFSQTPSDNDLSESLFSPYIYHSVNVITGEYCEAQTDLQLPGPNPVNLRRVYNSLDAAWRFNQPNIQEADTQPISLIQTRNGQFAYEYDTQYRLVTMKALNKNGDKTLGFFRFTYSPNQCDVEASNGNHVSYVFEKNQPGLIESNTSSNQKACRYQYINHSKDPNKKLISRREELNGSDCIIDYYDNTSTACDKVHVQKISLGSDHVILNRFVYLDGATEVYDAYDNKSIYRYSPEKRLTAIEEYNHGALCRTERFFWDSAKIPQMTSRALLNENGEIEICRTFEYDPHGNVIKETLYGNLTGHNHAPVVLNSAGEPISNGIEHYATYYHYTENAPYLLTKKLEDNGNAIQYIYNENNALVATFHCEGQHIHIRHFYAYDQDGFLIKESMDDGHSTDYNDLSGVTERHIKCITPYQELPAIGLPAITEERYLNLSTSEECLLKRIVHSYSSQGKIIREEVFEANISPCSVIHYAYRSNGQSISTTDANGSTTHKHYDNSGNLIKDDTHTHTYNALNQLVHTKEITADDHVGAHSFQYDLKGNKIASTNNLKQITQYKYDALGRLIRTIHPLVLDENDSPFQPIETFEYDICDHLIAHTDISGAVKRTRYNARGKPIEILYADGTCESFVYHLDGTLSSFKAKNEINTVFKCDFHGRATDIQLFDPNQKWLSTASATFNAFHQLSSTDPNGHTTFYHFDEAGRPLPAIAPEPVIPPIQEKIDAFQEKTVYDSYYDSIRDQNLLRLITTDTTGRITVAAYDALNRLENVTIKNSLGQVLSSKEMRYDAAGNKVRETYSLQMANGTEKGMTTRWAYHQNRLTKLVEFAETPCQITTSYTYDQLGKLATLTKPDGIALSYQYDNMGRVQIFTASDNSFRYCYTYDSLGNVINITDSMNASASKRSYNDSKQILSEQLGNGLTVSFTFDEQGKRTHMHLPDGSGIKYEYNAAVLSAIHRISPAGKMLYSHRYTSYNTSGKVTSSQLIGNLGCLSYTYNNQQRCTSIDSPYWSQNIEYQDGAKDFVQAITTNDSVGHAETAYTYDDLDQLATEEGAFNHSYTYDSLHNRISKDNKGHRIGTNNQLKRTSEATYLYNLNGCLIKKADEGKMTEFSYDALNRLIQVAQGKSKVTYTYDAFGRRLTKSIRHNKKIKTLRYLYDGMREMGAADSSGTIVELRVLDLNHSSEAHASIACEIDGKVYAPIHDCQGSICCLIDTGTKKIVETYRYSAFGETQIFSNETVINNPWRFAGKRYDEETRLFNFGKRLYDASTGRWLTPDPLGYADGPNRYLFVHNNPLNSQDLYGLFSFSDFWNDLVSSVSTVFTTIAEGVSQVVNYLGNFSYLKHIQKDIEYVGHQVLGKTYFAMVGYYVDYPEKGVYGNGEFNNKVRITAINGILNLREDCTNNVKTLSEVHGGINIHYVFHPTEGWTWDIINGFLAKCGYVSPQAKLLAQTWKELIQEMGGVNEGGKIIHYAHSIGGTNTDIARSLLTPDEQKMIRVITIGSATMIANEGFDEVVNYVSRRDAICGFGDPITYLHALFSQDSNILYVGSHWGVPFIDHLLTADTYRLLLEMLGRDFIRNYKTA